MNRLSCRIWSTFCKQKKFASSRRDSAIFYACVCRYAHRVSAQNLAWWSCLKPRLVEVYYCVSWICQVCSTTAYGTYALRCSAGLETTLAHAHDHVVILRVNYVLVSQADILSAQGETPCSWSTVQQLSWWIRWQMHSHYNYRWRASERVGSNPASRTGINVMQEPDVKLEIFPLKDVGRFRLAHRDELNAHSTGIQTGKPFLESWMCSMPTMSIWSRQICLKRCITTTVLSGRKALVTEQ